MNLTDGEKGVLAVVGVVIFVLLICLVMYFYRDYTDVFLEKGESISVTSSCQGFRGRTLTIKVLEMQQVTRGSVVFVEVNGVRESWENGHVYTTTDQNGSTCFVIHFFGVEKNPNTDPWTDQAKFGYPPTTQVVRPLQPKPPHEPKEHQERTPEPDVSFVPAGVTRLRPATLIRIGRNRIYIVPRAC